MFVLSNSEMTASKAVLVPLTILCIAISSGCSRNSDSLSATATNQDHDASTGSSLTATYADAAQTASGADSAVPLYDREYPVIAYAATAPTDRVASLMARIADGEIEFDAVPIRGYLDALLAALEIDPVSQTLVFSKTSLQVEFISAATPRAIYFNDDTYVAWAQGANSIEIATLDNFLGPVFYTLSQPPSDPQQVRSLQPALAPQFDRQIGLCLRCHDSLSLTGGGVPRFITGSGYIGRDGNIMTHEGWILTSDRTPLRSRWGGWYVSGFHGDQVHLGNIVVDSVYDLEDLESLRRGNLESVASILDTSNYITQFSDIVALSVLEHQVRVQNAIVRVNYDVRTALDRMGLQADAASISLELFDDRIEENIEELVGALLFQGVAPLTAPVSGTSGFAEYFSSQGVTDAQGRTLYALDLNDRVFTYPLSYMIGAPALDALPVAARQAVFARVVDQLDSPELPLGVTALEILEATNATFAAWREQSR